MNNILEIDEFANSEYYSYMITLKPHDVAILLKLIAKQAKRVGSTTADSAVPSIAQLSDDLFISASEVHAGLHRSEQAKLLDASKRQVRVSSLEEFMIHGLHYVFMGLKGSVTRGMPTSIAAPPLCFKFDEPDLPPVWPHAMGLKRGYELVPLYKKAPDAAAADANFYELLALTDALREGSARVRNMAIIELQQPHCLHN